MRFGLTEPPPAWIERAPILLTSAFSLTATPTEVFGVLADHRSWTTWFSGMRRVRVDGPAAGVGALRTVWVGPARVQERFLEWDPDVRLRFAVVGSNVPGLRTMVEDWALAPTANGTALTVRIGVEPAGPLRLFPGLVRHLVARSTRGAGGIATLF